MKTDETNSAPEVCAAQTVSVRGEVVTLRPLAREDETAIGDYFLSLSPQTRRFYGPHPFDRATAASICAGLGTPDGSRYVRLVAVASGRIVGYFIVYRGLHRDDRVRRYADLDPDTTCTLAPSVADDWQNGGLGTHLMAYAMACARRLGNKTMVLWGGVQAANARAVHFYVKSGFRKVGEFPTRVTRENGPEVIDNFDMKTDL